MTEAIRNLQLQQDQLIECARKQVAEGASVESDRVNFSCDGNGWRVSVKVGDDIVTSRHKDLAEAADDVVRKVKIVLVPPPLHGWFLQWLGDHFDAETDKPKTSLIYAKSASTQVQFVRDYLPMAWKAHSQAMAYKASQGEKMYGKNPPTAEDICVWVASEHRSKSCRLPVYRARITPGCTVTFRGNFYDWKLSVDNDDPVDIRNPEDLWDPHGDYLMDEVYFEGFRNEWIFESYGDGHKEKFSLMLPYVNEHLWAFFFLLWRAVR